MHISDLASTGFRVEVAIPGRRRPRADTYYSNPSIPESADTEWIKSEYAKRYPGATTITVTEIS